MIKIGDKYGISENGSGYSLQRRLLRRAIPWTRRERRSQVGRNLLGVDGILPRDSDRVLERADSILQRTEVSGEDMTLTEARLGGLRRSKTLCTRGLTWSGCSGFVGASTSADGRL